jgi:prepilin-type processing-associated H-X9-DG protein
MSNIRQITGAVLAYVDLNKTKLPWNYFQADNGALTWNGIVMLAVTKTLNVPLINDIYQSDVLSCPSDDSGVDAGFANVPTVQAHFRNNVYLPVLVAYGACPRLLGVPGSPPGNTGTFAANESFKMRTHYTLSGCHPAWINAGVFPNTKQLPNSYPGFRPPPMRITECRRPTESWIVYENSNCDVVPGNMVFRHPHLSANFGYLDGHVDNLSTTDLVGSVFIAGTYTVIGNDPRANLKP